MSHTAAGVSTCSRVHISHYVNLPFLSVLAVFLFLSTFVFQTIIAVRKGWRIFVFVSVFWFTFVCEFAFVFEFVFETM